MDKLAKVKPPLPEPLQDVPGRTGEMKPPNTIPATGGKPFL